jgi:hypothetical protein
VPGIYCLMHDPTFRCYVGSSFHVGGRVRGHLRGLIRGIHGNQKLRQMRKAGDPARQDGVAMVAAGVGAG